MPVGLETDALRGGPSGAMLSPEGIGHLRRAMVQQMQAQYGLRTNATLLHEQWRDIDTLLLRVAEQYMAGVMDLTSRGLTHTIGNVGRSDSLYQSIGRMDSAMTSMRMSAAGNNQRLPVTERAIPLPFAFEDWELDLTELEAMQRDGGALDTAYAEEAMRSVSERFEDWLFNGAPGQVHGGMTLYGYRTQPGRITGSGATWGTADNIYPTILAMVTAMLSINRPGPFALYMHVLQYGQMLAMEGVDRAWNVLRRLQESFPQIVAIKPSFAVVAGDVILVELQSRTVDVAIKLDPTNVPWDIMGGMAQHVRVIGSIVPRIKLDGAGKVGIVHYTGVA